MKSRVARKVLKRARQGRRYRLSTFRQARRWERRHDSPWGISRMVAVWNPLAAFTEAMDGLCRALARRLGIPTSIFGDSNYSSQAGPRVQEPRALLKSTGS